LKFSAKKLKKGSGGKAIKKDDEEEGDVKVSNDYLAMKMDQPSYLQEYQKDEDTKKGEEKKDGDEDDFERDEDDQTDSFQASGDDKAEQNKENDMKEALDQDDFMGNVEEEETEQGTNLDKKLENNTMITRTNGPIQVLVNIQVDKLGDKKKKKKKKEPKMKKVKAFSPQLLDMLFSFLGVSSLEKKEELKDTQSEVLRLFSAST